MPWQLGQRTLQTDGVSAAELNALYAAAVAAIDAADYALAVRALMAVKLRLITTPNVSHSIDGGGTQSTTWNIEQIDSLIKVCRQEQAAATGGIQQTKVVYARAGR